MKSLAAALVIAATVLIVGGSAMAQQKPEDAIKYRQSALFVMVKASARWARWQKETAPTTKK